VSIEALQLLSQLDEQKLIRALESEDIRLGCREWLLAQPDDYRLQKRQDLEERESRGESPLLHGHEAVALIRKGKRQVGVLSYGWLLPWEADPTGERLGILRRVLHEHPYIKALFIDQATLYQPPRTEEQDAKFNRALKVMSPSAPRTRVSVWGGVSEIYRTLGLPHPWASNAAKYGRYVFGGGSRMLLRVKLHMGRTFCQCVRPMLGSFLRRPYPG